MTQRKSATAPILTAVIAVVVFLLPASYVLSIGPAYRAYSYDRLDWETYERVYFPLLVVARASPAFADLLAAYGDWWAQ